MLVYQRVRHGLHYGLSHQSFWDDRWDMDLSHQPEKDSGPLAQNSQRAWAMPHWMRNR
jgi:hypothetical protein